MKKKNKIKCRKCKKSFKKYLLPGNNEARICKKCRKKSYIKKCRLCDMRVKVNAGVKICVDNKLYTVHKSCVNKRKWLM